MPVILISVGVLAIAIAAYAKAFVVEGGRPEEGPVARKARYLALLRVPLIAGAILLLLPPLAMWARPVRRMIGSMFVQSPWELALVTALTMLVAMAVTATALLILDEADDRYGAGQLRLVWPAWLSRMLAGSEESRRWNRQVLLILGLSVPMVVAAMVRSIADARAVCGADGLPGYEPLIVAVPCGPGTVGVYVLGAAIGLLLGLAAIEATAWAGRTLGSSDKDPGILPESGKVFRKRAPREPVAERRGWERRLIAALDAIQHFVLRIAHFIAGLFRLPELLDGVSAKDDRGRYRLVRGHRAAFGQLTMALVFYFAFLLMLYPRDAATSYGCVPGAPAGFCFPTIGFVLLLLIILTWGLAGLGYLLDKVHGSLVAVVAVVAVIGLVPAAHYYEVRVPGEHRCDARVVSRPGADEGSPAAPSVRRGRQAPPAAAPAAMPTPDTKTKGLGDAASRRLENAEAARDEREQERSPGQRLREPLPEDRPVVVVAAQGGGILAGAWAAEVLTRLEGDEEAGEAFTGRLTALSTVSGGSLGAVHYLADFDGDERRDEKALEAVRRAAAAPGLRATMWGIAYPDAWSPIKEALFRGADLVSRQLGSAATGIQCWLGGQRLVDRAWALERAWLRSLRHERERAGIANEGDGMSLADWRQRIDAGRLPVPLINATTVQGGHPFIVAPLSLEADPSHDDRVLGSREAFEGYRDFISTYSPPPRATDGAEADVDAQLADIDMLTAARLSATFPYVSPIARPLVDALPSETGFRLADGGYYDNQGVATLAEWLESVLKEEEDVGVQEEVDGDDESEPPTRVLLINILMADCEPREGGDWQPGQCRTADEHREDMRIAYSQLNVLRGRPTSPETVAGACRLPLGEVASMLAASTSSDEPGAGAGPDLDTQASRLPTSTGFEDAIIGPLTVLLSARTSMQHVRNDRALSDLHRRWQDEAEAAADATGGGDAMSLGARSRPESELYEQLAPMAAEGSPFEVVTCVSFVYQGEAPLSWQLSDGEIVRMREWWQERYAKRDRQGPASPELRTVRAWLAHR